MNQSLTRDVTRQYTAFALTLSFMLPLIFATIAPANAQIGQPRQPRKGISLGKKVALVGGAALLYYLFRKNQAKKAEQQALAQRGNGEAVGRPQAVQAQMPQLYRSKNGGIYYRDAQKNPVWLTVPSQPVQVSSRDLQRYAPDYNQYQGPAPAAPRGYRTQPFEDFDSNAYGGGSMMPPGPGTRNNGY